MKKRLTKRVVRKYFQGFPVGYMIDIEKEKDGYITTNLTNGLVGVVYIKFYKDGTVYFSTTKETCNRSPLQLEDWR